MKNDLGLFKTFLLWRERNNNNSTVFWCCLSLFFAAFYSFLGLQRAFSSAYAVNNDARVYVFWMQRFLDPELLPQDLIADYFKSVTPWGFTAIYWLMAHLGITPLFLSKILPPILGLITTGYGFAVCLQILPVPMAGFISTLLLNQSLWLNDDLASATPRAFVYPLFLAFIYYLFQRNWQAVAGAIALLGLFYPPFLFISAGVLILRLGYWQGGFRFSRDRSDYLLAAVGLGVALLVMLPYAFSASDYDPIVTAAQAREMPEFATQGRISFFNRDPFEFWLFGMHSGFLLSVSSLNPLVITSLFLPLLLRNSSRFPLAKQVTSKVTALPQILLVSLSLFLAAHALFFRLFLPSRYGQHSPRIVFTFAAGIALTIILNTLVHSLQNRRRWLTGGAIALIWVGLILYPHALKKFPRDGYIFGGVPALYEFLNQQPKTSLIASLSAEADNLPTFSQRSILVGREYAVPYHLGYYRQIRQRVTNLIRAQYSSDLAAAQTLIQKYGVDFWLVEVTAFTPEYLNNRWLRQYQPAVTEAQVKMQQGNIPALAGLTESCAVFKTGNFVVLEATCIAKAAPQANSR